jgi:hypothetical protein
MTSIGPVKVSIIRGSPIRTLDRTLVPLARLVSAHGHRGIVRGDSVEGTGWRAEFVRPLAVVEDRGGTAHVLPIPDKTSTVLWQMALVAFVVPIMAAVLIVANRLAEDR